MNYDTRTREKCVALYPAFALLVLDAIDLVRENTGLSMSITEGFRSHGSQAAEFAKGRTSPGKIVTKARPGQSAHQFGLAADLCFMSGNGFDNMPWSVFEAACLSKELVNGGTFSGLGDFCHCEKTFGMALLGLDKVYRDIGLTGLWQKLDKVRGGKSSEDKVKLLERLK